MTTKEFQVDDKTYRLVDPIDKDLREAEKRRLVALNDAIASGCFLAVQIYDKAKELGIWTDQKATDLQNLQVEMNALIAKLEAGGYEEEQAKKDVKEISRLRNKIFKINMSVQDLNSYSADSQADIAEEDYLLFCSIVNQNNKRAFKSFDQYMAAKRADDEIIRQALIAKVDINTDWIKELPENKLALEMEWVDEDLRFVDDIVDEPVEEVERKPFLRKGKPIEVKDKVEV